MKGVVGLAVCVKVEGSGKQRSEPWCYATRQGQFRSRERKEKTSCERSEVFAGYTGCSACTIAPYAPGTAEGTKGQHYTQPELGI